MKWVSTMPSAGGGDSAIWYLHWLGLTPAYRGSAADPPIEAGLPLFGIGYRPETSSATMSAADCGSRARATLCPAHSEIASISPLVPTIGAAGSYLTISSPEAKCAMTSPSPGRFPGGGRPAASHASAVELWRERLGASGHPTSYRLAYHRVSVSAASMTRRRYSSWMGISLASRNRV